MNNTETKTVVFVNAYEVSRHYGGPEEGGWWYDSGSPLASLPVRVTARVCEGGEIYLSDKSKEMVEEKIEGLKELFAEDFEGSRSRYSMAGDKDLEVYWEPEFAQGYPKERPHYE